MKGKLAMTLPEIPYRIAELIFKQLSKTIDDEELRILSEWLERSEKNRDLYHRLTRESAISDKLRQYKNFNEDRAWNDFRVQLGKGTKTRRSLVLKKISYAAAVLIPLFLAGYLYYTIWGKTDVDKGLIVPGTQMAILILDTGEEITLSGTESEKLIENEQVAILDSAKTLMYAHKSVKKPQDEDVKINSKPRFNTLITPRGGEYSLVLTDGTKIWLNADSKLSYPVEFSGDKREIFIEGEAYLKVAHNEAMPFIVHTNDVAVQVLGTSFNVRAYHNDPDMATTLIEGKVRIVVKDSAAHSPLRADLTPGTQAVLKKSTKTLKLIPVDTMGYMAWKEGLFVFEHEDLASIMRRLERWYNFSTLYESEELRDYHFSGTLSRYDDIETLLEMLTLTTKIEFDIQKRVIRVKVKSKG